MFDAAASRHLVKLVKDKSKITVKKIISFTNEKVKWLVIGALDVYLSLPDGHFTALIEYVRI